uniref:RETREG1-3/ARL6IP-like N-terminal reticulon-homology domain-containing protein n=2 Tax=Suricata suricatta TaxID=37032 RepID=A0A673VUF7_SURSU
MGKTANLHKPLFSLVLKTSWGGRESPRLRGLCRAARAGIRRRGGAGAQRRRPAPGPLSTEGLVSRAHLRPPPDNACPTSSRTKFQQVSLAALNSSSRRYHDNHTGSIRSQNNLGTAAVQPLPKGLGGASSFWALVGHPLSPPPRPCTASLSFDLDFKSCAGQRLVGLSLNMGSSHPMRSGLRGGCRERRLAYISGLRGVPSRYGRCAGFFGQLAWRAGGLCSLRTMAEGDNRSTNLLAAETASLEEQLQGWGEVMLMADKVLRWERAWFPPAIVGVVSLVFLTIYYLDPSVLSGVSCFVMFLCLADYLVPILAPRIFGSNKWTTEQQQRFHEICSNLVKTRRRAVGWWKRLFTLKEEKPKMYFMTMIVSLAAVAWVGQQVHNLLLTYLIVTFLLLLPGLNQHGIILKYIGMAKREINKLLKQKEKKNE